MGRPKNVTVASVEWVDATPERLRHAEAAGMEIPVSELMTPSGQPSGVKFRKIDGAVDIALRHDWITNRQWMAGAKFMHLLHGAKLEARVTANYDKVIVDGSRNSTISDYRDHCMKTVGRCMARLPTKYRDPWMSWCYKGLHDDASVSELGRYFSRAKHLPAQLHKGKKVLREILDALAKEFGL